MVLKDIMAISGQPGLYRFIAQGKNAIIVEHLETKKRSSAFSSARVSSLEEISVFTEEEDMPLSKVFDLIFEKGNSGPAIDYKSDPEKLKSWFESILPSYNKEKVYVSDIKKIAQWYNILKDQDLHIKEEPVASEDVSTAENTSMAEDTSKAEDAGTAENTPEAESKGKGTDSANNSLSENKKNTVIKKKASSGKASGAELSNERKGKSKPSAGKQSKTTNK